MDVEDLSQPSKSHFQSGATPLSCRSNYSSLSFSGSPSFENSSWSQYPMRPSEDRPLNILYIPDPSRTMSRVQTDETISWAHKEITEAQYDDIKGLSNFVYKIGERHGKVKVLVNEWVCSILLLQLCD